MWLEVSPAAGGLCFLVDVSEGEPMTVVEEMARFSGQFGRRLVVGRTSWRYYRLGAGPPVLWLTGGLRRAALGFAFMERLAVRHTVIAPRPDGRRVHGRLRWHPSNREHRHLCVGRSFLRWIAGAGVSGALDDGCRPAHPVEHGAGGLWPSLAASGRDPYRAGEHPARENGQGPAGPGLLRAITLPEAERAEWAAAINAIVHNDLSRADVVSRFAVAADLIRTGVVAPAAFRTWTGRVVAPAAFRTWTGRVVALNAENDPTQNKKDAPRYENLVGRGIDVINLGRLGHTAALVDPNTYVDVLERALA